MPSSGAAPRDPPATTTARNLCCSTVRSPYSHSQTMRALHWESYVLRNFTVVNQGWQESQYSPGNGARSGSPDAATCWASQAGSLTTVFSLFRMTSALRQKRPSNRFWLNLYRSTIEDLTLKGLSRTMHKATRRPFHIHRWLYKLLTGASRRCWSTFTIQLWRLPIEESPCSHFRTPSGPRIVMNRGGYSARTPHDPRYRIGVCDDILRCQPETGSAKDQWAVAS